MYSMSYLFPTVLLEVRTIVHSFHGWGIRDRSYVLHLRFPVSNWRSRWSQASSPPILVFQPLLYTDLDSDLSPQTLHFLFGA